MVPPLVGEYLQNGVYRPFPTETAVDGAIWGYSPRLRLNLRWNDADGWSCSTQYTGEILRDRRGERLAREAAEQELVESREIIRQLREQLREQSQLPE